jgi:hypothetical protein
VWTGLWELQLELRYELRSFRGRMTEARKRRLYSQGLLVSGPMEYDSTHSQQSDSRIFARNRDTQQICDEKKWASLTDLQLFLSGWDRGAEWALRESSPDSCNEQESLKSNSQ